MATSAPRDALIGTLVGGRYQVLRLIGRGGTGSIYEVRNVRLGRSFALKTLSADAARDTDALQRFRREADIVARIKHPNIVEVIDWDELPDGSPCIVMEYLRGSDLAARIGQSGALPWPQIALIADQVLAALTTTHASGVVHRDLKPANVFLAVDDSGDERVKLLDFGVSKIRDSTLQTLNHRLIGTPAYMAPEQAEGRSEDIGPHTDMWAMAIILHEMATGVRAFEGASLPALLYGVCHGEPKPIGTHRHDAPAAFSQLIEDALKRPIGERLADAATMRARLREALRDVGGVDYKKMPAIRTSTMTPRAVTSEALANTLDSTPSARTVSGAPASAGSAHARVDPIPSSKWRSRLLAGIGALGAGAAATVIVLRNDRESPSSVGESAVAIVVQHDDSIAEPRAIADAAPLAGAMVDAHPATPDAGVAAPAKPRPTSRAQAPASALTVDRVTAAVSSKMAALGRCIENSPDSEFGDITVTIEIAPNGRATNVTIAPTAVASSALGECLRAGLLEVAYPVSEQGGKVKLPLRTVRREPNRSGPQTK